MKAIDFICDLFSPRKPVGSIIRNKVLDEVIDSVHIDSVRTYDIMMKNESYTPEFIRGYKVATKEILLIIAKLRSKDENTNI